VFLIRTQQITSGLRGKEIEQKEMSTGGNSNPGGASGKRLEKEKRLPQKSRDL